MREDVELIVRAHDRSCQDPCTHDEECYGLLGCDAMKFVRHEKKVGGGGGITYQNIIVVVFAATRT